MVYLLWYILTRQIFVCHFSYSHKMNLFTPSIDFLIFYCWIFSWFFIFIFFYCFRLIKLTSRVWAGGCVPQNEKIAYISKWSKPKKLFGMYDSFELQQLFIPVYHYFSEQNFHLISWVFFIRTQKLMKPSHILNFFYLKTKNALNNMFLISWLKDYFLSCNCISE